MPFAEGHTAVQLTVEGRWKLKQLAVQRREPMYKVLEDLINKASLEQADEHSGHEPCVERFATQGQ